jgi:hypothetical protein
MKTRIVVGMTPKVVDVVLIIADGSETPGLVQILLQKLFI